MLMNSIHTWQSTWYCVYGPMSCICLLMCIYEYTLIVFLCSNTFIHFMQIQDMHGGDICCYSWLHSWDHWSLSWLEFLVLLLSVLSFIVIFIKVLQACPPWRNFPLGFQNSSPQSGWGAYCLILWLWPMNASLRFLNRVDTGSKLP